MSSCTSRLIASALIASVLLPCGVAFVVMPARDLRHAGPSPSLALADEPAARSEVSDGGQAARHDNPALTDADAELDRVTVLRTVTQIGGYHSFNTLHRRPGLTVYLRGPQVTEALVAHVSRLDDLLELRLTDVSITPAMMGSIGAIAELEDLGIDRMPVTIAYAINRQRGLPADFFGSKIDPVTEDGLRHLIGLKKLRVLNIDSSAITDAGLRQLAKIEALERLTLSGDGFTDAGLASLAEMPRLRSLLLFNKHISDAGIAHLRNAKALRSVVLSSPRLTDATMATLGVMPQIDYLMLTAPQITDAGLEHLKGLSKLWVLHLHKAAVTDAGLKSLRGLTALEQLDLWDTRVHGEGLKHLAACVQIEQLRLEGPETDDSALEHLHQFPKLWSLSLGAGFGRGKLPEPRITDRGLAHLKNLTTLRTLFLTNTRITDAGLKHLAGLPELKYVHIYKSPGVSEAGGRELEQSLQSSWRDVTVNN